VEVCEYDVDSRTEFALGRDEGFGDCDFGLWGDSVFGMGGGEEGVSKKMMRRYVELSQLSKAGAPSNRNANTEL